MNKQKKKNGNGIGWTDYTFNPIAGCFHGCRWTMPDGSEANCYADDVASGIASLAYPEGFRNHYWKPEKLHEPFDLPRPSKIFLGSMADVMGNWVEEEQIEQVLKTCGEASQHTFQLLTKNAPRLLKFAFPPNVWVGVSIPPTFFSGHQLTMDQQRRMFEKSLQVLEQVKATVRWMSLEPLSWDVAPLMSGHPLQWAVVGAASRGRTFYQPKPEWVSDLLHIFDGGGTPMYMKSNLAWEPRRTDFPKHKKAR